MVNPFPTRIGRCLSHEKITRHTKPSRAPGAELPTCTPGDGESPPSWEPGLVARGCALWTLWRASGQAAESTPSAGSSTQVRCWHERGLKCGHTRGDWGHHGGTGGTPQARFHAYRKHPRNAGDEQCGEKEDYKCGEALTPHGGARVGYRTGAEYHSCPHSWLAWPTHRGG